MSKIITTEDFIKKAILIHGDKYDYSLVEYINTRTKIKIICREHNVIFEQTPNAHLNGSGCAICGRKKCNDSRKMTNDEFKIKANIVHNYAYDYSISKCSGFYNDIEIICKVHGKFIQKVRKHLYGHGCKKCANEKLMINNFVEKCQEKYKEYDFDYSEIVYKGMFIPITIICKKHVPFEKKPVSFYHKERICPMCVNRTSSKPEKIWLDKLNIPEEYRNYYISIKDKMFCVDGIDIDNKIIYEFYGDFYHGNPKIYDKNRMNTLLKETFGDLYLKTMERKEYIEKNSEYKIIFTWENNFNKK